MNKTIKAWIEAMRLRTLPVSVSGVIMGIGFACAFGRFHAIPAILCLLFAVTAQIASNFANEYYDYKAGLDRVGRIGPRRGVTEGDITPRAMKYSTFATLALASLLGLGLVPFGGLWLIGLGIVIAIGVIAYSAGPFPLSHHGLGEVAVMFFFGIIPVNLTFYLQSGVWNLWVALASISVGFMGANVLIVNNYRDADDDSKVGKRTLAVRFGRRAMASFYLTNGYLAVALMAYIWWVSAPFALAIPAVYLVAHTVVWWKLTSLPIEKLNPLLGITALLMLFYSLGFCLLAAS